MRASAQKGETVMRVRIGQAACAALVFAGVLALAGCDKHEPVNAEQAGKALDEAAGKAVVAGEQALQASKTAARQAADSASDAADKVVDASKQAGAAAADASAEAAQKAADAMREAAQRLRAGQNSQD
ncbi:MAG: hypothetical protein ABI629_22035 [bacterium]